MFTTNGLINPVYFESQKMACVRSCILGNNDVCSFVEYPWERHTLLATVQFFIDISGILNITFPFPEPQQGAFFELGTFA